MVDGKKGTTTLGIVCKDGIVLASDKRASMGHLAADRVDKIFEVTDKIGITTAGSVGDAQMLYNFLKSRMELYKINKEQEPTVNVASHLLSNVLFSGSKNFFPYQTLLILAGQGEKGWTLFTLDPSGANVENKYIATGSGMELALGVLEQSYKSGIKVEAAKKLAIKAMISAVRRDVFSGEGIDIVVIDAKGYRKVDYHKFKDVLRDE